MYLIAPRMYANNICIHMYIFAKYLELSVRDVDSEEENLYLPFVDPPSQNKRYSQQRGKGQEENKRNPLSSGLQNSSRLYTVNNVMR